MQGLSAAHRNRRKDQERFFAAVLCVRGIGNGACISVHGGSTPFCCAPCGGGGVSPLSYACSSGVCGVLWPCAWHLHGDFPRSRPLPCQNSHAHRPPGIDYSMRRRPRRPTQRISSDFFSWSLLSFFARASCTVHLASAAPFGFYLNFSTYFSKLAKKSSPVPSWTGERKEANQFLTGWLSIIFLVIASNSSYSS